VTCNNWLVFNNSSVTVDSSSTSRVCFENGGTGNKVQNNLWFNSPDASHCLGTPPVVDHNYYINTTFAPGEANAQTAPATDPFVPRDSLNFQLTRPTDPGVTLPAPFNTDMRGRVRGADGVWDRGALEFVRPARPTNLRSP